MAALLALPLFLLIFIGIFVFVLHFLPSFVAFNRRADNFIWILLINIFFGWTLIGWVVALIWAFNDRPRHPVGYISQPPYNR
jgi:predicted membrane protein